MTKYLMLSCMAAFQTLALAIGGPEKDRPNYVPELGASIKVFDTVFPIYPESQFPAFRLVLKHLKLKKGDAVLDIGTGTGILGLIAAKRGAGKVVATDINPLAVQNAQENADDLGFGKFFEARLVSVKDPGAYAVIKDERFDWIISAPPLKSSPAGSDWREYWEKDPGLQLARSMVEGARSHLKKDGRLLFTYGFTQDHVRYIEKLASENNLKSRIVGRYTGNNEYDFYVFELRL